MNINIVELQPGDVLLTTVDIGNLPQNEVDAYVKKCVKTVKSFFWRSSCRISSPRRNMGFHHRSKAED